MVERLTAAEAASQIVGLINSRPATPWPQEIEAIIARVAAPAGGRTAALDTVTPLLAAAYGEWDRVRRLLVEPGEDVSDDAYRDLDNRLVEKTEALFSIGARTFADLQLLVPAVVHWNSPMAVGAPNYPESVFADGPDKAEGWDDRSVAHFIRAVRDLLGKLTCADGGPNLSVDYAEFAALTTRSRKHADATPRGCDVHDPAMRAWEAHLSELSEAADKRADAIIQSANPDPRALAAIIWHYLADAYLDRVDLSKLPEPINFGIGQDAAVLLAARILQGQGVTP